MQMLPGEEGKSAITRVQMRETNISMLLNAVNALRFTLESNKGRDTVGGRSRAEIEPELASLPDQIERARGDLRALRQESGVW